VEFAAFISALQLPAAYTRRVKHMRLGSTKNSLLSKQLVVSTGNRGEPGLLWGLGHLFARLPNPAFQSGFSPKSFLSKAVKS